MILNLILSLILNFDFESDAGLQICRFAELQLRRVADSPNCSLAGFAELQLRLRRIVDSPDCRPAEFAGLQIRQITDSPDSRLA